jgi:hypothetical protein
MSIGGFETFILLVSLNQGKAFFAQGFLLNWWINGVWTSQTITLFHKERALSWLGSYPHVPSNSGAKHHGMDDERSASCATGSSGTQRNAK